MLALGWMREGGVQMTDVQMLLAAWLALLAYDVALWVRLPRVARPQRITWSWIALFVLFMLAPTGLELALFSGESLGARMLYGPALLVGLVLVLILFSMGALLVVECLRTALAGCWYAAEMVSRWASASVASTPNKAFATPRTLPERPFVVYPRWPSGHPTAGVTSAALPIAIGDSDSDSDRQSRPATATNVASARPTGIQRRRRLLAAPHAAGLTRPPALNIPTSAARA
jgi:hypothetical protein